MWWLAALAGASVAGGVAQAYYGGKAAEAQEDAARQAYETQMQQYQQQLHRFEPYRQTSLAALGQLQAIAGLPQQGYQQPQQPLGAQPQMSMLGRVV